MEKPLWYFDPLFLGICWVYLSNSIDIESNICAQEATWTDLKCIFRRLPPKNCRHYTCFQAFKVPLLLINAIAVIASPNRIPGEGVQAEACNWCCNWKVPQRQMTFYSTWTLSFDELCTFGVGKHGTHRASSNRFCRCVRKRSRA